MTYGRAHSRLLKSLVRTSRVDGRRSSAGDGHGLPSDAIELPTELMMPFNGIQQCSKRARTKET